MNSKKTAGIVIVIIGVVMLFISGYIRGQVEEGKGKVTKAQGQVDTGNTLFSVNPVSKQVGQAFTGSAQKKIDMGKEQIAQYEKYANVLQIGGIAVIIVGGIVFFLGRKRQ